MRSVQFRVLGGETVRDGAGALVEMTPQAAQAVALLLIVGRAVSGDRLKELMWDVPPKSNAFHNLLLRLRKALGPARFEERSGYYQVAAGPHDWYDLCVFRALVARARRRAAEADPRAALGIYRHALELWDDPALPHLSATRAATTLADALKDEHLDAVLRVAELHLALGEPQQAARELAPLRAERPENEQLLELHMLALHRCGERARALNAYSAYAETARAEGYVPGKGVHGLRDRIAAHHPSLDAAPAPEHPADRAFRASGADVAASTPLCVEYHTYVRDVFSTAEHRAAAEIFEAVLPGTSHLARLATVFQLNAALAMHRLGIRRFLDVGAMLPHAYSLHETLTDARVVYAFEDPGVARYAGTRIDAPLVEIAAASLAEPRTLLNLPAVRRFRHEDEPVGIVIHSAANYVVNGQAVIRALLREMPRGSHLALVCPTWEGMSALARTRLAAAAAGQPPLRLVLRSVAEIRALFDGLTLLPPGPDLPADVADTAACWSPTGTQSDDPGFRALGGFARLDDPAALQPAPIEYPRYPRTSRAPFRHETEHR